MSGRPFRHVGFHRLLTHRQRSGIALCSLIAFAISAAGCGDDHLPPATPITVKPPALPAIDDCGLSGAGSARNAERPPKPGTYTYRLTGSRTLIGEKKEVRRLPAQMKAIVTDARRKGAQSCFALQRRYESDLGETGVFVINGHDTFLRSGRFQAGADVTEVTPDPSLLIVSGSELEWSGSFRGPTSGRYRATVTGRKRIRIDGKPVAVVGIEQRVSYAGEIEGYEQSVRWFSMQHGLVIAESVTQDRTFGLDHLRLRFKSKILSLKPS